MKTLFFTLLVLFTEKGAFAQEVIRLYEGTAPGSEDHEYPPFIVG